MSARPARGPKAPPPDLEIRDARPDEIGELLPLMRAYCDFYEVAPPDDGLRALARAVSSEPGQGALLIARDGESAAVGFAVLDWKWATTAGARVGHLEDLFVDPGARGTGVAEALIGACAERCREWGISSLAWVTAPDNRRAQTVYERVGARGQSWLEYELELDR